MSNLGRQGRLRLPDAPEKLLASLWALVRFECNHHWGWPRSHWVGPDHHRRREHYQVCGACGAEKEYRGDLVTS
jgi:hypothetical protein